MSTRSAPPSPLSDRYALGGVLGIGGTAVVHRATHRESGRVVAVKIFTAGTAAPGGLPDHRSVAAVLAEAHHPGLVEIYESGVDADRMYLVMRLVEGESLAARLAEGPLAAADVPGMGAALADALAHVHDRGIVHRDIKPSNILLDVHRSPYLTDFGISRLVDTTRVTATGMAVGTPAFMAPEQVRGARVGPAADIYSLGLVLLEAVTGRREYPGGVVESAVARLHRDPVVPPGLPGPLGGLLAAMTAQDPALRPTAAAVAGRLRAPSGTTREIPSAGAPRRAAGLRRLALPGSRPRADAWTAAAAAVVLLAAATSGLIDLTGGPGPATTVSGQLPTAPGEQTVIPAPLTLDAAPGGDATATSVSPRTAPAGAGTRQGAAAAGHGTSSGPAGDRPVTDPPGAGSQAARKETSGSTSAKGGSGDVPKGRKSPKGTGRKG